MKINLCSVYLRIVMGIEILSHFYSSMSIIHYCMLSVFQYHFSFPCNMLVSCELTFSKDILHLVIVFRTNGSKCVTQ